MGAAEATKQQPSGWCVSPTLRSDLGQKSPRVTGLHVWHDLVGELADCKFGGRCFSARAELGHAPIIEPTAAAGTKHAPPPTIS